MLGRSSVNLVTLDQVSSVNPAVQDSWLQITPDSRFKNVGALIVKVTHRCNLDCQYCYEDIVKGQDMSLETFEGLVNRVFSATVKKEVLFLFHGGEPTLVPDSWYEASVAYAKTIAKEYGKRAKFAVQSNILALTEAKLDLFKQLDIRLSVSLDGPPELPGAMRPRAERALANYMIAIERGQRPGVLMTINHSNFQYFSEICHWLETVLDVSGFKANPISSVGHGYGLPDLRAEQVFRAYRDILEYMISTEGKRVIEDNLCLELIRYFSSPQERSQLSVELCRDQRCGAGERVIGITPGGQLLPCGRFQWNDEQYYLGNVNDMLTNGLFNEFQQSIDRFHALVPENWYDCQVCEARHVCSFGCQAFIVRSKSEANVDCLPTKMRFEYFVENEDRLEPLYDVIKNRSRRFSHLSEQTTGDNYRDAYNDDGPYNDTYNDDKGSYSDVYSDTEYGDTSYSDVRGYDDYSDQYSDG
jgi:uncharacterized protein